MNMVPQFILSLIRYAEKLGIAPQRLCALSDIDWDALNRGESSTLPQINSLWQNAAKLSGDPYIGLHLGEEANLTALGIVGQLITNSPTIEAALQHACAFIGLTTDAFRLQLVKSGTHFQLEILPDPDCQQDYPFALEQSIDVALVFVLNEYKALVLGNIRPAGVSFRKSQPNNVKEYERIFQCPISFNTSETAIQFEANLLPQRIITADYELLNLLHRHAEHLLTIQSTLPVFATQVRKSLINRMHISLPQLPDMAAGFNMSVRTFQRKLSEEGTSYQKLSDAVRKEFAIRYLENRDARIKEISWMLGYNEVSAFTRSFKRWTGKTPAEWRA